MSRNTHPLIPAKPAEITLDTLPQLFAHHRATWGGMSMTITPPEPTPPAPPGPIERPDGVSEDEWNALGDPGKQAIHRERTARVEAERALIAARARPKAPGGQTDPPPANAPTPPAPAPPAGGEPDLAKIIQDAVTAAVKPFQDRDDQREADSLAEKIRTSVVDAAKDRFYDASDALTGIDLTQVTDGNGRPDPEKIKGQLDGLLQTKPHLGKPTDSRRRGEPGSGSGGGPSDLNIDDRVKDTLARMQASTPGVKIAGAGSTSTT